jgi:3-oxoacyl-[acyl-carrier protein] reductase
MALGALEAGARVIFASSGPSAPLDATIERAKAIGPQERWLSVYGDLRNPDDCERVARDAAGKFGAIDALVNNAAIPNNGDGEPFWKIATEDWARVVRTNVDTVFFMARAVAPAMIARGSGRIINVSTSARTMVRPRFSPYGPTKAFMDAATRLWAGELEGTGVSMNVLAPGGVVDTASDVTGVAGAGKSYLPADVMVAPLLWLLSKDAAGINGQRFVASQWDETLPLEQRIERARESRGANPQIM